MMYTEDLKRVAPLWLQYSKDVRHDPDVRHPPVHRVSVNRCCLHAMSRVQG